MTIPVIVEDRVLVELRGSHLLHGAEPGLMALLHTSRLTSTNRAGAFTIWGWIKLLFRWHSDSGNTCAPEIVIVSKEKQIRTLWGL